MYEHLCGAEIGSPRPTELMEIMKAALPPGDPVGHLLKAVFLQLLLREAVQFQQLEAMELTKLAEII